MHKRQAYASLIATSSVLFSALCICAVCLVSTHATIRVQQTVPERQAAQANSSEDCGIIATSPTNGLRIEIPPQPCVFTLEQARRGISFKYAVVIERTIARFVRGPQDAGCCQQPGPSGLYVFAQVYGHGDGQRYAMYDLGLCDCARQRVARRAVLKKGRYAEDFFWNGVNWLGPSDFNNPQGRAFPPGTYWLELKISHFREKLPPEYVIARMQIRLVEN